mmetsp:Transcript_18522/g.70262  ORF Transcript_18522/g.70262 Transcript_18522/m.70262 type:complete len:211 (+) Transcript_18522:436-1068(+)
MAAVAAVMSAEPSRSWKGEVASEPLEALAGVLPLDVEVVVAAEPSADLLAAAAVRSAGPPPPVPAAASVEPLAASAASAAAAADDDDDDPGDAVAGSAVGRRCAGLAGDPASVPVSSFGKTIARAAGAALLLQGALRWPADDPPVAVSPAQQEAATPPSEPAAWEAPSAFVAVDAWLEDPAPQSHLQLHTLMLQPQPQGQRLASSLCLRP